MRRAAEASKQGGVILPLVLMPEHGGIPMTVRAMKASVVDFLTKPFRDQDMIDAVGNAVELHRSRRTSILKARDSQGPV